MRLTASSRLGNDPPPTEFQVVLNWADDLKRVAPVKKP
jgi:hypothetical protein